MGMTAEERVAKAEIIRLLRREGYPTYANIFNEFHFNLTSNPRIIGFMEQAKGRIVMNRYLDEDQVSVIIRHEILHFYLEHELRMINKLARDTGLDPDKLDDLSINELKTKLYSNKIFNIAADYEISNRGYTEKDKRNVRAINLNGKLLSGLVTEDQHPDWADMSLEELYDNVKKEREQEKDDILNDLLDELSDMDDFSDPDEGDGSGGSGSSGSSGSDEGDGSGGSGSSGSSGPDEGDGSGGSSGDSPQIGDKPSDEELEKEDAEREKKIKKELDELGEEGETEGEYKARLKRIADLLKDQSTANQVRNETERNVYKDRAEQIRKEKEAERAAKKYTASKSIEDFVLDLNKFVRSEVKRVTHQTWTRMNPSYEGTGILMKGRERIDRKDIPIINVYFDQSGSWDKKDIKLGVDAINTLKRYEKKGLIKIRVKYFADDVHGTAAEARAERGTKAGKKLIEDIINTKPDNVIIMTDSDFDYYPEINNAPKITVKGAVWLLFRNNAVSRKLINHIKGKKVTQIYQFYSADDD